MPGVVYALTNSAMPGLVKIGITEADHELRMSQLYSTGVPLPFECVMAKRVENAAELERALHIAFGPSRVNPRREFFQIGVEQVVALLKAFPGEEVTKLVEERGKAEPEEEAAAKRFSKRRRPNLNWDQMGVPRGAVLHFEHGDETATIIDARRVSFRGEERYLSDATRIALGVDYHVNPGPYWRYEGELVRDIYNRAYGSLDEPSE